jgi:hypothetical protein
VKVKLFVVRFMCSWISEASAVSCLSRDAKKFRALASTR